MGERDADRAWSGWAAHEIDACAIADPALRREMLSARRPFSHAAVAASSTVPLHRPRRDR